MATPTVNYGRQLRRVRGSPARYDGPQEVRTRLARFKKLNVTRILLDDLQPQRERRLSPRQRAAHERDDEIRAALDLAATMPSSEAVVIEPREGVKLGTLRAAVDRVLRAEPRQLNWGVRGQRIVFSKGDIPGGRRRQSR